jgi:hypothetical protein
MHYGCTLPDSEILVVVLADGLHRARGRAGLADTYCSPGDSIRTVPHVEDLLVTLHTKEKLTRANNNGCHKAAKCITV